jgi:hypothetical protein
MSAKKQEEIQTEWLQLRYLNRAGQDRNVHIDVHAFESQMPDEHRIDFGVDQIHLAQRAAQAKSLKGKPCRIVKIIQVTMVIEVERYVHNE